MNEKKSLSPLVLIIVLEVSGVFISSFVLGGAKNFAASFVGQCLTSLMCFSLALYGLKIYEFDLKKIFSFRGVKTYVWALALYLMLEIIFGFLPALEIVLAEGAGVGVRFVLTRQTVLFNAVIYLLVGFSEELFCRVFVQETLERYAPERRGLAVVVSAVIFGIMHFMHFDFGHMFNAALIGAALGFCKMRFKSCTYVSCALAHALYDYMIPLMVYVYA